jgi:hypothetical protein
LSNVFSASSASATPWMMLMIVMNPFGDTSRLRRMSTSWVRASIPSPRTTAGGTGAPGIS